MSSYLEKYGIEGAGPVHANLPAPCLYEHIIRGKEGLLAPGGAVAVRTDPHTGRSPRDKYIVDDPSIHDRIWWGPVNRPLTREKFEGIFQRLRQYLAGRELFIQDCQVGAGVGKRLPLRIITETAWHSLLARSLYLPPEQPPPGNMDAVLTVLHIPSFLADPAVDGTSSEVFIIIDLTEKMILIGGTRYGGEIKKSVFTAMNYLLPRERRILPMHCSATAGRQGDVAIFFGLSGTGKTTLSADPERHLIGDDEHGWDDAGIFNLEGGCYAKIIRLSRELEPEIYACTSRFGAILENVAIDEDTRIVDLDDAAVTENTRAAYPLEFIPNAVPTGAGDHPKNIFMLTCDAFGVLPPISRLTTGQAMYHFLSGYTARVAGTEDGMAKEPQAVFSACFGAPFLPLHPSAYAEFLKEKIDRHGAGCWLVNTGWSGGGAGIGRRIPIDHTRALIHAALDGNLDHVRFVREPFFGLRIPVECPGIPAGILNPRDAWADKQAYDGTARDLADRFRNNFAQFGGVVPPETAAEFPR